MSNDMMSLPAAIGLLLQGRREAAAEVSGYLRVGLERGADGDH